ncbi:MAG: DUF4290 domain-containing protein [Bacteroidales bacterium]|jgi:hypothetical protein|nr:DUF4290 domain-containing protein [Bacteroidales bacterium]
MKYNTNSKRLALPEYGRNIQNMVDYCLTVENRDERNRCANAIISIMGNLFPHLRDVNDFKHILWDHLAVMADFKLDVDYPYEIVKKENLHQRPPRIEYSDAAIIYRHYGQMLERLIDKAAEREDGEEKEMLIYLIANQMKKSFLIWNKDSVDNQKILKDLAELSERRIVRNVGTIKFVETIDLIETPQRNTTAKKNKKNHSRKG